jgi:hypothetical protein
VIIAVQAILTFLPVTAVTLHLDVRMNLRKNPGGEDWTRSIAVVRIILKRLLFSLFFLW